MVSCQKSILSRFGMLQNFFLILTILFASKDLTFGSSRYKHYHRAPIINLNGVEELIGVIREDEKIVSIVPQLQILNDTGPICHYKLQFFDNNAFFRDDFPFESEVIDKTLGTAIIRLKKNVVLDCSNNTFVVQVFAVSCANDNAISEPVILTITVKDTNNHAPEFEAPWYTFNVEEGKITEIARLEATDADCGQPYGAICRYEITSTFDDNYFHIDNQGVLSTVRMLNASEADSHILSVVAHDCGRLSSKSILITVHVLHKCFDGLTIKKSNDNFENILTKPDSFVKINYSPNQKTKILPNAEMNLCPTNSICTVKSATAKISYYQQPIYNEIDFESLKKCNFNSKNVELLPIDIQLPVISKASELKDEFDENLAEDEDDEDEDISDEKFKTPEKLFNKTNNVLTEKNFLFDGKTTAVTISKDKIKHTIPEKFTLTFAMKHNPGTNQQKNIKQNIICETDNFNMNRHHFAVYIRQCKLELLLRREAKNAILDSRAAEWRWQTPEVCDGKWHSYAIVFNDLNDVNLFVDGNKFKNTELNPKILDDQPLHETKNHDTRLVVGACWHGREKALVQHFNGYLARMYLIPNVVESESSIECLHKRNERLNFDAIHLLTLGESVIFDKPQNDIILRANNLKNLSALVRNILFEHDFKELINFNKKREFSVTSHVECIENNKTIPLGSHKAEILLTKPEKPKFQLILKSNETYFTIKNTTLKNGVNIIPNIQIFVIQSNFDNSLERDVTPAHHLDWCKMYFTPPIEMAYEYFSNPASSNTFLNIAFEHDIKGIILKGDEKVKNYADILSKIHYYHIRPDSYTKRMYSVQCSMLNSKILSNKLDFEMNIVSDEINNKATFMNKKYNFENDIEHYDSSIILNNEQEPLKFEKHFELSYDHLGANRLQNNLDLKVDLPKTFLGSRRVLETGQGVVAVVNLGGAMAILVVIFIAFLLVLLFVGMFKMRESVLPTRRNRKANMEGMEWDDNGLNMNITVNPLINVNKSQNLEIASTYGSECGESVSDDDSFRDDDISDDEDDERVNGVAVLPHTGNTKQGLEWDDSTLGGDTSVAHNLSKKYCV